MLRRGALGFWLVCLLALISLGSATHALAQDPLQQIRQRGVILVGVKNDYPLFGQIAGDGSLEGFEVDLARDIAQRLGVRAQLVVVTSANRLQRLEDGTVDLVIATLGDTEQRRRIATLLEPNYYASGVNIMVPPGSLIEKWSDLRGKQVCATQGAFFNRLVAERYLVNLQLFNNNRDALLAVRAGRCEGWIYDDTAIAAELLSPEWSGWRMALPSGLLTQWALALPRRHRETTLRRNIEEIIGDWHRVGFLIELEQRWSIPKSDFLRRTKDLWQARNARGEPLCLRDEDGQWPQECRNRALLTSTDVTGLMRVGLLVKEQTGLDFSIFYDRYDRNNFFHGLAMTLLLVVGSMGGALTFGILGALAVDWRVPVLMQSLRAVLTVLRMTPPLLQIYVTFFGAGLWLSSRWGILIDPLLTVLLCLSAYAGAAVAQALLDTAPVLAGAGQDCRLRRATLGRALYAARGSIIGILVNIAKATGMASVIAVPEVISASTAIMAERGNVTVIMNVLMVTYFLIVLGTVVVLSRLQRKLERLLPPLPARG